MSDKIPVSIYQVNLNPFAGADFNDIATIIIQKINNEEEETYIEQDTLGFDRDQYNVRLYWKKRVYAPAWRKFIKNFVPPEAEIYSCLSETYSFICFIGYRNHIFAISGGSGSVALERFVVQNFGLQILVRVFEKNSKVIKSIQDRGVTGVILGQTRHYRGDQRMSDDNQFGKIYKLVNAELNRELLTNIFGFTDAELNRDRSGLLVANAFKINKSINFPRFLTLIKKLTDILTLEEKFSLNKVQLITKRTQQNQKLIKELENCLVERLFEYYQRDETSDLDFCHPKFEDYMNATYFKIPFNDDEDETIELEKPITLEEIIRQIKHRERLLDEDVHHFKRSCLERVLFTYDENNMSLTKGTVLNHLHGEIEYRENTYFLVDGDWYHIHPDFIRDLNEECFEMLDDVWDDTLIDEEFIFPGKESTFNCQFIGKENWLVLDTITPENIESCDLLKYTNNDLYLVHVKKGFNNSIRELASQVVIAAKRISRDSKSGYIYLRKVQSQTQDCMMSDSAVMREIGNQPFPPGGLSGLFANKKAKHICFCLAFVDEVDEDRSLKNDLISFRSNIAKFTLLELKREIISLGFDFKVIQLAKAAT